MITVEQANMLANDQEFMDAFAMADTMEEVHAVFSNKGVEVTDEEIEQIMQTIVTGKASESGELSETDLDDVNGGCGLGVALLCFASAHFMGTLGKIWLRWR